MSWRIVVLLVAYSQLAGACLGGDTLPKPGIEPRIDASPPHEDLGDRADVDPYTGPAAKPELPPPPPKAAEQGVSGLLQAIPATKWRPAMVVENAWNGLKKIADQAQVHGELRRSGLERTACHGLVDFRGLDAAKIPPFSYRDNTRGRSWARPTVARVLIEGLEQLRKELPGITLTIGDLSQPGCGQLSHGSLIRYVTDGDAYHLVDGPRSKAAEGPATRLINAAQLQMGVSTAQELVEAADLGAEAGRLEVPDESVLVEHRIVSQGEARDGSVYLKVATRRFRPLLLGAGEGATRMLVETRALIKNGMLVKSAKVRDQRSEDGKKLWLQHWVNPAQKRQVTVLSKRRIKKRLRASWLVEVQSARWQPKKPDSFPGLIRWFPMSVEGSKEPVWHGWRQLYEAGHQTHLAGRDADLSYVTRDNRGHFAVSLDGIDLEKSWRWFEILDETSRGLGAKVDRILVAPSVWRLFRAKFGKTKRRSRVWRLLRRVRGHDAHHHIRIEIPNKKVSRASADFLDERRGKDDLVFSFPPGSGKPPKNPTPPKPPR